MPYSVGNAKDNNATPSIMVNNGWLNNDVRLYLWSVEMGGGCTRLRVNYSMNDGRIGLHVNFRGVQIAKEVISIVYQT